MIIRVIALASAWLSVLGGGTASNLSGPGIGAATPSDSVFWRVKAVALQEPADNPIGEITDLEVLPDGRFLVLDGMSAALRLHDENGFLEQTVGRKGSGPGEFRLPVDLAVNTAGQVFVADIGLNRITRFTPNLEFDTTFAVPGQGVGSVKAAGDRILAITYRRFEDVILILDFDGRILGSFHPFEPETFSIPYWEAISRPFLGAGKDRYYVATAPLYPIRRYALAGRLRRPSTQPAVTFGAGDEKCRSGRRQSRAEGGFWPVRQQPGCYRVRREKALPFTPMQDRARTAPWYLLLGFPTPFSQSTVSPAIPGWFSTGAPWKHGGSRAGPPASTSPTTGDLSGPFPGSVRFDGKGSGTGPGRPSPQPFDASPQRARKEVTKAWARSGSTASEARVMATVRAR